MRPRLRTFAVLLGIVLVFGAEAFADVIVTGEIRTPIGANSLAYDVPVGGIRVIVMNQNPQGDGEFMAYNYTDSAGRFSITVQNPANRQLSLYINVEYAGYCDSCNSSPTLQLTSVCGGLSCHTQLSLEKDIEVRNVNLEQFPILDENVGPDSNPGTFHSIQAGTLDLQILRVRSTQANIVTQAVSALNFLWSYSSSFTSGDQPDNIRFEGRPAPDGGSTGITPAADVISVRNEDYDQPPPTPSQLTGFGAIDKQLFYWALYRSHGRHWPTPDCGADLGIPEDNWLETCTGNALTRAAAARLVAQLLGVSVSPDPTSWRGDDGCAKKFPPGDPSIDSNCPIGTGANNAGDVVSGALYRIFSQLPFRAFVIAVMDANNIDEFRTQWLEIYSSPGASEVEQFFNVAQENGIVFTRGRITGFMEGPPDPLGLVAEGNSVVVDGYTFLRGLVTPVITQLTGNELHLGSKTNVVPAKSKRLFYKPAVNGLSDNHGSFFKAVDEFGNSSFNFQARSRWDTWSVEDGDFDVAVQLQNQYGHDDRLGLPDFGGDPDSAVNTNEKWLKTLGTWFNSNTLPLDGQDKFGEVIVDNTPPVISGVSPCSGHCQ